MQLDVRGEMCPYPAMKTKDALKKLKGDEPLVILTDHAPALSTVPWEGAKQGYAFSIDAAGPGEWRIELLPTAKPLDQRQALAEIHRRASELAGDDA